MERDPERLDPPAGKIARMTPYELAFGDIEWEARVFPMLQEEAEETGSDPALRDRFAFLTVGGDVLRDLTPPDAPAEAREDYLLLLYHVFNFWRFGKRVYLLDPPLARYLVEAKPRLRGWDFALPYASVYLQLPANLFWASISPESTPEPVDGFFVTSVPTPLGEEYRRLEVLMILGIRRDRAGYSVIPFDTEVGPGIPAVWAETPGRERGKDFENILPGGEISGLYSILTTTEALKLVARALWYVDSHPEDVFPEAAPERRTADSPGSPPWSRLPYFRVSFGAGEHGGGAGAEENGGGNEEENGEESPQENET